MPQNGLLLFATPCETILRLCGFNQVINYFIRNVLFIAWRNGVCSPLQTQLEGRKLNKLMYYFLYRGLESARSDSHYVTEVYNLLNLNKEIGIYFASASRAFATVNVCREMP